MVTGGRRRMGGAGRKKRESEQIENENDSMDAVRGAAGC